MTEYSSFCVNEQCKYDVQGQRIKVGQTTFSTRNQESYEANPLDDFSYSNFRSPDNGSEGMQEKKDLNMRGLAGNSKMELNRPIRSLR
jgi:hypothetical protein